MVGTHGIAAAIRSSETNETFDLAGMSEDAISRLIQTSFQKPFTTTTPPKKINMIKITLVVGAGKHARQKYDANAAKTVKSTLIEKCGYQEDAGASCVMECGGTFKSQHDTGKNLYTVLVFPKLTTSTMGEPSSLSSGSGTATNTTTTATAEAKPLIPKDSAGYKIATASINVFINMIKSKCPSWSQKRGCISALEQVQKLIREMDDILIKGQPLDDAGQAFYDEVMDLDSKVKHLKKEMHDMVDHEQITTFEKQVLLEQNLERIELLQKDGKSINKALERKRLLESIEPIPPHKLKYEAEIGKLRKELATLLKMEANAKGRLLSVKETQTLARKDEILEDIQELELASRGWFEEEDVFQSRVDACRLKFDKSKRFGGGGGSGEGGKKGLVASVGADTKVNSSVNRWVVPGAGKTKGSNSAYKKKGGRSGGGGGLFQAMVMDSDSESDEDESVVEDEDVAVKKAENVQTRISAAKSPPVASKKVEPPVKEQSKPTPKATSTEKTIDGSGKKTKKKKKKKKKKGGSPTVANEADSSKVENEVVEESVQHEGETAVESTESEQQKSTIVVILNLLFSFIKDFIVPIFLAIITWIITFFFGKPKKSKSKKR